MEKDSIQISSMTETDAAIILQNYRTHAESFRDRPDLPDGQSDAKTGMIQISLFLDPAQVAEIERAASSMVISAFLTTDLEAKPRKQS